MPLTQSRAVLTTVLLRVAASGAAAEEPPVTGRPQRGIPSTPRDRPAPGPADRTRPGGPSSELLPLSGRAVKEAVQVSADLSPERDFATRYAWEERRMWSDGSKKGLRAFVEERAPCWRGRRLRRALDRVVGRHHHEYRFSESCISDVRFDEYRPID